VLSLVQANDKRNSDLENEIDALGDMAKKAAELADDADLEKAAKDAEAALEVATKSMEAAGKMMEALGGLGR
jgi:alkylation response protein AidB-like acyl-CoA dehydrogenase